MKTFEPLPDCLTKKVTIYKKAGSWYISFSIEKEFEPITKERERVGVDFGVKTLALLISGVEFKALNPDRKAQQKLTRTQRRLAKKVKGYKNWEKSKLQVQKLHRRVANLRKDYLHKMTTYIAKNHSEVVIEDLNVSGMMANHK